MVDKILPHLHMGLDTSDAEGIKTTWQRSVWLVLAVTLHYIPEGLAVVVAFGANAVLKIQSILTYALAFAAGEMIYVVVEELIPEAQREEGGSKTDIATIGVMIGFTVMMVLDVALG